MLLLTYVMKMENVDLEVFCYDIFPYGGIIFLSFCPLTNLFPDHEVLWGKEVIAP